MPFNGNKHWKGAEKGATGAEHWRVRPGEMAARISPTCTATSSPGAQQPYDFNGSDQSARRIDLPSIVAQAVFAESILILTRSIGDRARIANFACDAR
jgi:hypothetical protein